MDSLSAEGKDLAYNIEEARKTSATNTQLPSTTAIENTQNKKSEIHLLKESTENNKS